MTEILIQLQIITMDYRVYIEAGNFILTIHMPYSNDVYNSIGFFQRCIAI